MKYFTIIKLLSLTAISFTVLSYGCASRDTKDSPMSDKNGVLQDIGQEVCLDVNSGKMWQVERGGKFTSYQEAEQYAANLRLGGYDDWRLPRKTELFDLYYIFYWKRNGNCTLNPTGEYWSHDDGKSSLGHWETYIVCAPNYKYVESVGTKGYVRAVRD